MEPPEVLAIHAVPHPNPKVRRVGFTLDDPYVEQVWAGVIGPSALLVLRRLPVLWREREPAVVDLRELDRSLGLGASLARSGRTWRTIERLVGFGMAHWLPGTSSACALRWRRSPAAARTAARVDPPGPRPAARHTPRPARPLPHRRVPPPRPVPQDRPVPRHRPPDRPPRPPPAPPPPDHPRPRPPAMTVPRRCPVLVPRGSLTVVPTTRPSAHTLAGAPAGHLPTVPRVSPGSLSPRWAGPAVPRAGSSTPSSAAPRPPRQRSPPRHPPAPQ
jgi:hypothetical protein